jgi:hypothetical protein
MEGIEHLVGDRGRCPSRGAPVLLPTEIPAASYQSYESSTNRTQSNISTYFTYLKGSTLQHTPYRLISESRTSFDVLKKYPNI